MVPLSKLHAEGFFSSPVASSSQCPDKTDEQQDHPVRLRRPPLHGRGMSGRGQLDRRKACYAKFPLTTFQPRPISLQAAR